MPRPSAKESLNLIQKLKNDIKNSDTYKDLCKEYDQSEDIIDLIPVKFDDIDVSAETNAGIISLNWNILEEGDAARALGLLIHECEHYLRQCQEPTQSADEGSYLDNPDEIKPFQSQLRFLNEEFGHEEANDYVEQVLDHHDVKDKKREKKKEELMELVSSAKLFLSLTKGI